MTTVRISRTVIDESAVLDATGENHLECVRQLIMRGMQLRSFDRACAIGLRSLTVRVVMMLAMYDTTPNAIRISSIRVPNILCGVLCTWYICIFRLATEAVSRLIRNNVPNNVPGTSGCCSYCTQQ